MPLPDDDLPIDEELVPPPAPLWSCRGCGWVGPSRELDRVNLDLRKNEIVTYMVCVCCPTCGSTEVGMGKEEG